MHECKVKEIFGGKEAGLDHKILDAQPNNRSSACAHVLSDV